MTFAAGASGSWQIDRIDTAVGEALPAAKRLTIHQGAEDLPMSGSDWMLRGVTSNARYTRRSEADALNSRQQGLSRPQATRAALIPIRKTEAWWALAQDERRAILEEQSRHIAIGLDYLPAIARRLHHSRELGEPFDFITWFEYAPQDADAFEELVRRLRRTEEWRFVDREIDIRLTRL